MTGTNEDIILCRCEDITLGEVRKALEKGATTLDEIKRVTRAGMGPCQGRTCRLLIAAEIARFLGKPVSKISQSRYRSPTKPVKMGDLALMSEKAQRDCAKRDCAKKDGLENSPEVRR